MRARRIYNKKFASRDFNASPLTISSLEGDLYDYRVFLFTGLGLDDATACQWYLQCNSDTATNYRNYELKGAGTSATAAAGNSDSSINIMEGPGNTFTTSTGFMTMIDITGPSGYERSVSSWECGADTNLVSKLNYGWWQNTADEITSITIGSDDADKYDAHIMIWAIPRDASQSKWQLIEKQSLSSTDINASPIDFTGLSGDTDIQYKLELDLEATATELYRLFLNNDTGANYEEQFHRTNTGTDFSTNLTSNEVNLSYTSAMADQIFYSAVINAESGEDRTILSKFTNNDASGIETAEEMVWWQNTADELTSIKIDTSTASSVTGEARLYRRSNPDSISDLLPYELFHSKDLSSTDYSAGDTISITGNSYDLIKIEGLIKNTTGDIELRAQFNADTGSNYEEQDLKADTSTSSAAANTRTYLTLCKLQNANMSYFETYMYLPNTGRSRPAVTRMGYDDNAVEHISQAWDNTADEITSIKIFASSTDGITGNIKVSRVSGAAPITPLAPSSISGLQLWVDGDNAYTDMSSNAYTVTNNGSTVSSGALNGHDVFQFLGSSSQYIDIGTQLGKPASFTTIAVFRTTIAVTTRQFVCASLSSSGQSKTCWGDHAISQTSYPTGSLTTCHSNDTIYRDSYTAGSKIVQNQWTISMNSYNSGDTDSAIYLDGVQESLTHGGSGSPTTNSGTAYDMVIGRPGAFNGIYFTGDLAEFIVYDASISSEEKEGLNQYLKDKYAL